MKKIDLGQMISILANLGVIAGIVFLGYELRQNNRFLSEQARYSVLQNQVGWTNMVAENADVAKLAFASPESEPLTRVEQLQRGELIAGLLRRWEWEYERSQLGIADLAPIEGWIQAFDRFNVASDWEDLKSWFSPEFVNYIDTEVLAR